MNDILRKAADLIKRGNKTQAAKLLSSLVQNEPDNANAWYGLSLCMDELDKRKYCLQRVISINPSHDKAKQALERLNKSSGMKEIAQEENIITVSENKLLKILGMILGVLIMVIGVLYLIPEKTPSPYYNSATSTPKSMLPPTWTLTPTKKVLTFTPRPSRTPLPTQIDLKQYVPLLSELPENFAMQKYEEKIVNEYSQLYSVTFVNYSAIKGEPATLNYFITTYKTDLDARNNLHDIFPIDKNDYELAINEEKSSKYEYVDGNIEILIALSEDGTTMYTFLAASIDNIIVLTYTISVVPPIEVERGLENIYSKSYEYFDLSLQKFGN